MMDKSKRVLMLPHDFDEKDIRGYRAIDVTEYCFGELDSDPWETMRILRRLMPGEKLRLTFAGQALLGSRHYSDDTVDAFVAAAVENGIDTFRVYDALNDSRNLTAPFAAVKKYGAKLEAAAVYAENSVHSIPFFAGYAALLASMGADTVSVIGLNNEFTCRELTDAVKKAVDLPIALSVSSEKIADIALDASADSVEISFAEEIAPELKNEIEFVRADAGCPPMIFPIFSIISDQAQRNASSEERYKNVSKDFKSLILGKFGKTPAPIAGGFAESICGGEPMMLVRPADTLEAEYSELREKTSPWLEEDEDVLTYALFGASAVEFFEKRKAEKYRLDQLHAHPEKGIHII